MGNPETLTSIKFKSMKAHHIDDERINKNHRFLESQNGLGWKGPLRSSSTTPCYRQGPLPLDQVAQNSIQPRAASFHFIVNTQSFEALKLWVMLFTQRSHSFPQMRSESNQALLICGQEFIGSQHLSYKVWKMTNTVHFQNQTYKGDLIPCMSAFFQYFQWY